MQQLRNRIPNLSALTFFEAAARLQSFTQAAAELHVTQGAVSRQIKLLESSLQTTLFQRFHRAVKLTPQGVLLHQTVSLALRQIQATATSITEDIDNKQLTIAATQAVSTFWLMPRLPRLQAAFPTLQLNVLASDSELEVLGDRFDIGLRYGSGQWPGYRSQSLGHYLIFPVCSPSYLAEPLHNAAELTQYALLYLDYHPHHWLDWPAWFAIKQVAAPYPRPALRANSYPLMIQAAVNGQGIALGWDHLIQDHLNNGTLITALADPIQSHQQIYLSIPENRTPADPIKQVSHWLSKEFQT